MHNTCSCINFCNYLVSEPNPQLTLFFVTFTNPNHNHDMQDDELVPVLLADSGWGHVQLTHLNATTSIDRGFLKGMWPKCTSGVKYIRDAGAPSKIDRVYNIAGALPPCYMLLLFIGGVQRQTGCSDSLEQFCHLSLGNATNDATPNQHRHITSTSNRLLCQPLHHTNS